ncbi:tRNA-dihydrouridine synthase 3 [Ophiocordyceps camponoti-floridani]|uniref:tRNA-dihydrouridine(47) synthase [NAD(P)(+)] n=1 Tax=Ophiocordyceps camponoti-floridani TaxID=2030778 RepID=A0A8H4VFF2_9HYPO|nr:tRNA-dihydrouridine synthase 3 [Ophiocordyceps camponoti-floridani]
MPDEDERQVRAENNGDGFASEERAAKRLKMETPAEAQDAKSETQPPADTGNKAGGHDRRSGLAPVKKEYLLDVSALKITASDAVDDDEAEARGAVNEPGAGGGDKKKKKKKGQNTERSFGKFDDAIRLCNSRASYPEFSPGECKFGDRCKMSHDIRYYLAEGRRADLETFDGKCPVFEQYGSCPSGWRCRFVKSHMDEVTHEDGRTELILRAASASKDVPDKDKNEEKNGDEEPSLDQEDQRYGVINVISMSNKILLNRKRLDFSKADQYISWMNQEAEVNSDFHHRRKSQSPRSIDDLRARFVDPPFKPSEKRRLYFGPETPTLAPLTTQGNLPFRRLCVELGCQLTYSEMAMSLPLLQGSKADWTLLRAHESEMTPPRFDPSRTIVFDNYVNADDVKFGAQISGNQPWAVTKAADALQRFCPRLRLIDLNCGCPIDMVFKSGGGSALLESQGKMERMVRGMNAMSGAIPVTAKIRTGVKGNRPVATQVLGRLAFGAREHRERLGAPGCAAVTLHGRSREQRYTKRADWSYIAECAALVASYNSKRGVLTDTAAAPDESSLPNSVDGRMYFIGNGDCYSHVDYFSHIEKARVDTVMIGRGALIKPWIFEEIEKGQYLDKSSTQRLAYIERFVRFGLDAWGSDELGIGFTRRFLLEWLSFAHRYLPIGLLEHLPPNINDRPPAYRGRDELETLMASPNYKDWIKISEMFLGPVQSGFQFQPKHRSNAYEAEG